MKLYPSAEPGARTRNRKPRMFAYAGEIRAPRKGEWYLSGAIVEAYRARADLSQAFHIAREVTP